MHFPIARESVAITDRADTTGRVPATRISRMATPIYTDSQQTFWSRHSTIILSEYITWTVARLSELTLAIRNPLYVCFMMQSEEKFVRQYYEKTRRYVTKPPSMDNWQDTTSHRNSYICTVTLLLWQRLLPARRVTSWIYSWYSIFKLNGAGCQVGPATFSHSSWHFMKPAHWETLWNIGPEESP